MNIVSNGGFVSFVCKSCHQEIEASMDMIGEHTECPACGAPIVVPSVSQQGTLHGLNGQSQQPLSPAAAQAMKSRTIRIELNNM